MKQSWRFAKVAETENKEHLISLLAENLVKKERETVKTLRMLHLQRRLHMSLHQRYLIHMMPDFVN